MRLDLFVADLLFDHDCVVVPDFGGLVANYRSARLNRISHELFPPSKHVGFNKNLVKNDGLLANHIASVLGISYKDALSRIADNVSEMERALQQNGRIAWDKIGVFFKDRSGQLQFIPDEQENFLTEAFGLSPIQLRPIAQESAIETPVVEMVVNSEKRSRTGWKVAAVLIPLALATYMFTAGPWHDKNTSAAGWNIFSQNRVESSYHLKTNASSFDPSYYQIEDQFNKTISEAQGSEEIVYDFQNDRPDAKGLHIIIGNNKVEKALQPVEEIKTPVVESQPEYHYAVIGGAFAVKENALRFINNLKKDGFDARLAGRKGDLHLVAYGFYKNHSEAQHALANIRSSQNQHAWIKSY